MHQDIAINTAGIIQQKVVQNVLERKNNMNSCQPSPEQLQKLKIEKSIDGIRRFMFEGKIKISLVDAARFWDKVDITETCWNWRWESRGYAQFKFNGQFDGYKDVGQEDK